MTAPGEVLARVHELFLVRDVAGVADLLAEDVVVERPFAPAGTARRVAGREQFRTELTARLTGLDVEFLGFESVVMHETADPELIIVEFTLRGRIPSRDYVFRRPYIQVLRMRGGRIAFWRDYYEPTGLLTLWELSAEAGDRPGSRDG